VRQMWMVNIGSVDADVSYVDFKTPVLPLPLIEGSTYGYVFPADVVCSLSVSASTFAPNECYRSTLIVRYERL
jgi:hypothetical protein